jgi:hypothetical protein
MLSDFAGYLAMSRKILVDVFVAYYEFVSSCLLFPYSFPFFYYCSKDTLNNRNSQTFLVILEIYNQMLRGYQLNPVFIMWDCILVRPKKL